MIQVQVAVDVTEVTGVTERAPNALSSEELHVLDRGSDLLLLLLLVVVVVVVLVVVVGERKGKRGKG